MVFLNGVTASLHLWFVESLLSFWKEVCLAGSMWVGWGGVVHIVFLISCLSGKEIGPHLEI